MMLALEAAVPDKFLSSKSEDGQRRRCDV